MRRRRVARAASVRTCSAPPRRPSSSYEHGIVKLHDLAEYRAAAARGRPHRSPRSGGSSSTTRSSARSRRRWARSSTRAQYAFVNKSLKKRDTTQFVDELVQTYGASAIAQVLDAFKDLGFRYATQAGITISKNDVVVPPDKEEILARYEERGRARSRTSTTMGLITQEERHEAVIDQWNAATDEVAEAMEREPRPTLNPIYMMANSGARGSFKQIRQLAGMRGLMANPKGEIIERPDQGQLHGGPVVLEYFISTHGARKGLADTALRTADSGYLTRRLVDVAQDVIIRDRGLRHRGAPRAAAVRARRRARTTCSSGASRRPTSRPSAAACSRGRAGDRPRGSSPSSLEAFDDERRTPTRPGALGAQVRGDRRACARRCYGRSLATGKLAQIGDAVGIIAAQSIGEPGTQLTMRTFHTGGVAGADITHGLPRVVELFEARKPKGLAKIAEVGGVVVDRGHRQGAHRRHHRRRRRGAPLHVPAPHAPATSTRARRSSRARSSTRARCTRTSCSTIRGRTATEVYLVKEVQEVYKSQGVDINDKHIELIVRQMLKKVRVDQKGDTDLLPGQFVDRHEFRRINDEVKKAEAASRPQSEEIILGITKASLATDSFLSAASFQETTKVLTDAALEGKIDRLAGLKENVIIGKLIPAATGLKRYRHDRDRAGRAAAPRDRRRRPARGRRPRRRAGARRRRGPAGLRPGVRHRRARRDQRRLRRRRAARSTTSAPTSTARGATTSKTGRRRAALSGASSSGPAGRSAASAAAGRCPGRRPAGGSGR